MQHQQKFLKIQLGSKHLSCCVSKVHLASDSFLIYKQLLNYANVFRDSGADFESNSQTAESGQRVPPHLLMLKEIIDSFVCLKLFEKAFRVKI